MNAGALHVIDHVYVFGDPAGPELPALAALGLAPDLHRRHVGQGTANACFGFADGYLELLWLVDEQEARDPLVKPLGLHERARWRETGASPLGIAVRPSVRGGQPPFPAWDYRPSYVPDDMTILMACNSGVLGEPLLFQIDRPFATFGQNQRLRHRRLQRVTVTVRDLAPMSLLRELSVPGLCLRDGTAPLLELEFAGAKSEADLRPTLPLLLRW